MADSGVNRLYHYLKVAREEVSKWMVGGVIIALTGFAPEEWLARIVDHAGVQEYLADWPKWLDPRISLVAIGVATATWDIHRRRKTYVPVSDTLIPAKTVTQGAVPAKAADPDLSIIVMPFANLGGVEQQDYFADGITEDLTTDLSRIPNTFVIGANTAFQYKGKGVDPRQVGRDLGVRYALTGSVRNSGEQVRVTAQLVRTDTGVQIWSDRFEGEVSRLAELQDRITSLIARSLDVQLITAESKRLELQHSRDPTAVDLVMRAMAAIRRAISPQTCREATDLYLQASERDPNDVQALAGIALCDMIGVINGWSSDPKAAMERATEFIAKARTVDPENEPSYCANALLSLARHLPEQMFAEAARGIALYRNSAMLYFFAGLARCYTGQADDADRFLDRAIALSPRDPQQGAWVQGKAFASFLRGEFSRAAQLGLEALEANDRRWITFAILSASFALTDDIPRAQWALGEAKKANPKLSLQWVRDNVMNFSENATFRQQRDKLYEGLAKAGLD